MSCSGRKNPYVFAKLHEQTILEIAEWDYRAYSQLLISGSGVPEGEDEGQVPAWKSET